MYFINFNQKGFVINEIASNITLNNYGLKYYKQL